MFEDEIKELFELCWRVANETDAFVTFEIASHVHACYICIKDGGYVPYTEYDFRTHIYFEKNSFFTDENKENFKKAKAHLLKLLINGKCPLNLEEGAK